MSSSWPGTLKRGSTSARDFPARQPYPAFVAWPTMQPLARIGSEPRASASIMPTISSVTKQILEALLLPGNQRVALHEVAFIEMNEPRQTGFERGVFD